MSKTRTSTGKAGVAVLKEYNHRCAVCGADRPQLHHIDGDPSNHDPLNLLPLCPNCHLTDQHNPTAAVDRRILQLFRVHKDPTILSPQFLPLFQRFEFLDNVKAMSLDDLIGRAEELTKFILQLEMGAFYGAQIEAKLKAPTWGYLLSGIHAPHEESSRRDERLRQHLDDYHAQLSAARDEVRKLAVELLRYQRWSSTPRNRGPRPPAT